MVLPTSLVFVNASEDLVMTTDVVMPSNPLVMPTKKEELEEPLLDVNVSQRSHDEKLFKRMVRIRVDYSIWDHRSSLNPHALAIYLEFVPNYGVAPKRFEEC